MDIRITAEHSREWPTEWDRLLQSISPRSAAYSYLYPKWEHVIGKVRGTWRDRSRWVLYQAQPAWAIPDGIRVMLEDRPPRLMPPGRAHARRMFVDDYAHEMYRVHRVFVRPFWVLQGNQGGVPAGYTFEEADLLKMLGEPTDPPPVGFLPYAPFDWRVCEQILMRDRLLASGMDADAITQEGQVLRTFRADMDRSVRDGRKGFLEWYKGTLAPGADFLDWYTRRSESDMVLRQATRGETRAAIDTEATFLETGLVPVLAAVA